MHDLSRRHWHISAVAAVNVVLCGSASVDYVVQDLQNDGPAIPVMVQLLCFALAFSGTVYFFHARLGHRLLAFFTVLTLFSIGTTDPHATVFHTAVLLILLIPVISALRRR